MKRREVLGGLFWLVAGLYLTYLSATTCPIGQISQPGPGFLPLGLGILLSLFSLVILGKALRLPPGKAGEPRLFSGHWLRVVLAVAVLLAAIFLFEPVGYLITFLGLGLLLTVLSGVMSWKGSLLFAALSVAGIYVIFVWLLKQPLPTGFLGV